MKQNITEEEVAEYFRLLDSFRFNRDSLDYAIADRHLRDIREIEASPLMSRVAVSIYDNCRRTHIYESPYHKRLFTGPDGAFTEVRIYPDEFGAVMRGCIAALRFFLDNGCNAKDYKFVREYRAFAAGKYRPITKSIQLLEPDSDGNPWLMLCIAEIISDEVEPFKVNSRIINVVNHSVINPEEDR